MPDDKRIIQPIDADFDKVAKAMVTPATSLAKNNSNLHAKRRQTPATPRQGVLDLGVEVERVVAGVEMGVLEKELVEIA